MNLPLLIARRYLFARKSHNVINIISGISAAGMALGTAALIIILSVYNGFDALIRSSLSDLDPDILITPSQGKVWTPDEQWLDSLAALDGVQSVCTILQDNVFADYGGAQGVALAKGVDEVWESVSPLSGHTGGVPFVLHRDTLAACALGAELARNLGVNTAFLTSLRLYYPRREGSVSPANPAASLRSITLPPATIFSVSAEADASLVILPIRQMRRLTSYTDGECTGVEIRTGTSPRQTARLVKELRRGAGEGLSVHGRTEQNPAIYKMMRYEKAAIFMILLFIVIIIAFNIFGSLTMLIIEKQEDIRTLRSLGADSRTVRRVFVLEGWMISLLGLSVGLVAGITLALLQQHLGLVGMPGALPGTAYPVVLKGSDILLTAGLVALIGYLIALLPSHKLRKADKK